MKNNKYLIIRIAATIFLLEFSIGLIWYIFNPWSPLDYIRIGSKNSGEILSEAYSLEQIGDCIGEMNLVKTSAELGNVEAMFWLGLRNAHGDENYCRTKSTSRNLPDAIKWMTKAAEGGFPAAQYQLGSWWDEGVAGFGEKDLTKAMSWTRKAALQGFVDAQLNMGHFYYNGGHTAATHPDRGGAIARAARENAMPLNYREALNWYQMASRQGSVSANIHISEIYQNGKGVERNLEKSLMWILVAERNSPLKDTPRIDKIEKIKRDISTEIGSEKVKKAKFLAEICTDTNHLLCGYE